MHEDIDKYAEEYQLEQANKLSLRNYPQQLTSVWLKMVKDYPHQYSMEDYFEACKRAGVLVF